MSGCHRAFLLAALASASLAANAQNTFPSNGNVGIGTTNPTSKLQVGAGSGDGITIGNPSDPLGTGGAYAIKFYGYRDVTPNVINAKITAERTNVCCSWLAQGLDLAFYTTNSNGAANADNSLERMRIKDNGNVGIGTAAPNNLLDVFRSQGGETDLYIENRNTVSANTQTGLVFGGFRDVSNPWPLAKIQVQSQTSAAGELAQNGEMRFYTGGYDFSGIVQRMVIQSGGNVGIGTAAPAYQLDVSGQIHASGGVVFPDGTTQTTAFNPTICGGDYAESIDVTGKRSSYEPGDLLAIDSNDPSKFVKSSEPYSTGIAGVYSTRPGTLGRRQLTPKSQDEVPMAVVGIVPAKVSAENGPIRPRDLLVSSGTPGYAMKGTDRSRLTGAVVGKAMGSLDSGTGVIEILVTLQ